LLPWLLGWGAAAEALDPAELREQLRTEALKLAQLLT
jgi:predicted DNA-binding transcriptional regulator YafY